MNTPSLVEAIFFAALDKKTAAERADYLAHACGDDAELSLRVKRLLKAHPQAADFLARPAIERHRIDPIDTAENTIEFGSASASAIDAGAAAGRPEAIETLAEEHGDELDEVLAVLQPSVRPGSLGRLANYEVQEVLGKGSFGTVVKAFDEKLHRPVAIKLMSTFLAATSAPRKRFLREARSAAAVRDENVIAIYAVEDQPIPYLVMEHIAGQTLQQKLDATGPLDVPDVLRIGREIAGGLAAAHAMGLIHRDIKPSNILLEHGVEHVKLTDFGLARAADDASISRSGLIAGTPMYMAPEQALGETIDQRADLFSLGSVLYVMCTGRPPFRAANTVAVLKRVTEQTPRPIREIIPEVPEWLCDLITRLHAKNPADRFSSAQEVADHLAEHMAEIQRPGNVLTLPVVPRSALENAPPLLEIPDTAPAIRRPNFRNRRWAAAAAVLVILSGGLGFTEATGVSDFRGTVIRLFSPDGTLVVEVDDPGISVKIDGSDLVIAGAGAKEIRLKPGSYTVETSKDGKVVRQELVTVTKNGRQVVRISQESLPPDAKAARQSADASAWERSVAAMSRNERVKAVGARLKELNPGFDGKVVPTIEYGVVTGLEFITDDVTDISPVRALTRLRSLTCCGSGVGKGQLSDLSPLKGLPLTSLNCSYSPVSDLSPLKDMKLTSLDCSWTKVSDLSLLKDMKLTTLNCCSTQVSDLSPLKDMKLTELRCNGTKVSDLSPLKDMKLTTLNCSGTTVTDLSPLKNMQLTYMNCLETQVSDLSPLKDMKLTTLYCFWTPVSDLSPLKDMNTLTQLFCEGTKVSDLSPLQGLPLIYLRCDFKAERDAKILRSIKTLENINAKPAKEFWMDVEAQTKDQ